MATANSLSHIRDQLSTYLQTKPKVVILGIGENRMGDDGLGPYLSFNLDQKLNIPNIRIINGGIVPEDRYSEIVDFQPNILLLIDAVDAGKPKGSVEFYDDARMMNYLPISSHSLPLPILVDRCKRDIPNLQVKLLGVQPFSLAFLDRYELFAEGKYSLDDKDENLNIPFYAFNMTDEIQEISNDILKIFLNTIQRIYS